MNYYWYKVTDNNGHDFHVCLGEVRKGMTVGHSSKLEHLAEIRHLKEIGCKVETWMRYAHDSRSGNR